MAESCELQNTGYTLRTHIVDTHSKHTLWIHTMWRHIEETHYRHTLWINTYCGHTHCGRIEQTDTLDVKA